MPRQLEVRVEGKAFLSLHFCGEKGQDYYWAITIDASCYHGGRCQLASGRDVRLTLALLTPISSYDQGANIKLECLSSSNYLTPFPNWCRKCKKRSTGFSWMHVSFLFFLGRLKYKEGGKIQYLLVSFSLWVTADDHLGTISQKEQNSIARLWCICQLVSFLQIQTSQETGFLSVKCQQ